MSVAARVPASFFGIVLGLAGAGQAWRAAHRAWDLPEVVGNALLLLATFVWAILLVMYVAKWLTSPSQARAELDHPIQCCFVGMIGVATMLIGIGTLTWSRSAAGLLCCLGGVFTIVFGVWRTGLLWRGGRDLGATTAVLYLPTVAGSFVTAVALATFGLRDWGQLAFGAGFFSWLAIESVLLVRLYHASELPALLRPTLGIQLAPPVVGLVALLAVADAAPPGASERALLGYGLLQAAILARDLRWAGNGGFVASYWSFSFGLTALATAPIVMLERGDRGAVAMLAPWLLAIASGCVGLLVIGTMWLLVIGRLLPPAAASAVTLAHVEGMASKPSRNSCTR